MAKTNQPLTHTSHKEVILRLKRAQGHLAKVVAMMDNDEPCPQIAQQLYAVVKALSEAKKNLIHDHIEHCLDEKNSKSRTANLAEFKEITKYL